MSAAPVPNAAPWYIEAFGRDYLERYAHRDEKSVRREIPFLAGVLNAAPGVTILDLCCGAGRYTRGLREAGFRAVGLDLSADLLARARKADPASPYHRADMRRLPLLASSVDGAVNLFTSFGYFEDDAENARVIREVFRVLRPGARFLLDFFNLRSTLADLVPESKRKVSGETVVETRRYDAAARRLLKEIRIEAPKAAKGKTRRPPKVMTESVRAYSPAELEALLLGAGLEIAGRYGTLEGAPFDEAASPRCVLVGRKVG